MLADPIQSTTSTHKPLTFFFYHYGHNMITTGFREQQQKDPAPLKAFQHITNSPRQTWNH